MGKLRCWIGEEGWGGILTWRYGGRVECPRRERDLRSRDVGDAVQGGGTCPPRVR